MPGLVDTTSIQVVWAPPDEHGVPIDGYELDVNGDIVSLGADVRQYVLGGILPATTHEFSLRAHNAYGWSAWSPKSEYTTDKTTPATPVPPKTEADIVARTISIEVIPPRPNGEPITRYEIEGKGPDYLNTTDLGLDTTYVFDYTVERIYEFRARAENSLGWSEWSDFAVVAGAPTASPSTPPSPPPPPPPKSVPPSPPPSYLPGLPGATTRRRRRQRRRCRRRRRRCPRCRRRRRAGRRPAIPPIQQVPNTPANVRRGAGVPGLDNRTYIHVVWDPPVPIAGNHVPLLTYELTIQAYDKRLAQHVTLKTEANGGDASAGNGYLVAQFGLNNQGDPAKLTPGQQLWFSVAACNEVGCSNHSAPPAELATAPSPEPFPWLWVAIPLGALLLCVASTWLLCWCTDLPKVIAPKLPEEAHARPARRLCRARLHADGGPGPGD